jgi:ribosomal-protein-alanine N-acetyltransferase
VAFPTVVSYTLGRAFWHGRSLQIAWLESHSVHDAIDTDRLRLRPFISDDVKFAFDWFGDPLVMRFTPSGPDRSMEQTAARIANYKRHQAKHGFSKWIIIERDLGRPIGDAGLLLLAEYGWIDFGYRLAQPFWGKGLATEAASAWVQKAFGELKLDRLAAIVHPENYASIRVLQKLGFLEERRDVIMGMSSIVCGLTPDTARNPIPHDWRSPLI